MIAAVYEQRSRLVPPVTRQVPYTVSAVTTTKTVHHPATTRELSVAASALSTQSRQGAERRSVSTTSSAVTGVRGTAVDIPLVSGASLSSGAGSSGTGSARTALASRDAWWADRAAGGGWYSSGPTYSTTASFASGSSTNVVVSDAPTGASFSAGGSIGGRSDGEMLGALTLLAGIAAAGAAGHQLGRAGGNALGSGRATSSAVRTGTATSVRAASRSADVVRSSVTSRSVYAAPSRRDSGQQASGGVSPGDGVLGWVSATAGQATGWLRDRTREGAYAVAGTGTTAALLARAAAYGVAETGNTADALARIVADDLADTPQAARALARGAYGVADGVGRLVDEAEDTPILGGAAQGIVTGVRLADALSAERRTPEQNEFLFGPDYHVDEYLDATTLKSVQVVTRATGGVLGTMNRERFGIDNTITLSDGLIVSPHAPGELELTKALAYHEAVHTRQADEDGLGYFKNYVGAAIGTAADQFAQGLAAVDLSAAISRAIDVKNLHDHHPMEIDADAQAGLTPGWETIKDYTPEGPFPFVWIHSDNINGQAEYDSLDARADRHETAASPEALPSTEPQTPLPS